MRVSFSYLDYLHNEIVTGYILVIIHPSFGFSLLIPRPVSVFPFGLSLCME
ncbi:hypothetical protein OIU76_013166 [Salix suchowensis]|nr:hypothetical protein OIU76_013166 [Salix suchowensis]